MDDKREPAWRIVSSTYPIATPFLRLRSDVVELPDGTIIDEYYVRETRGFCIIFALTADGRVILVRQYKHGAQQEVLELPAGAIDEGEAPRDCAIRELAEETGYAGDEPEHIRSFLADPTNSNGSFHVYLVRNASERFATDFDPTEDITVELAALDEVGRMIRDGRINAGSQVASVYTVLDHLDSIGP
ncbi:MAG: NUDIX hydrolase [Candidatus Velthaea sp.]